MEAYEQQRFGTENDRLFGFYMRQTRLKAIIIPMLEIVAAVGIAGVVWYGGYSALQSGQGGRTQGTFSPSSPRCSCSTIPSRGWRRRTRPSSRHWAPANASWSCSTPAADVVEPPNRARVGGHPHRHPVRAGELPVRQDWVLRAIDLENPLR